MLTTINVSNNAQKILITTQLIELVRLHALVFIIRMIVLEDVLKFAQRTLIFSVITINVLINVLRTGIPIITQEHVHSHAKQAMLAI